jgi:starch-binding outer membrane protein, SusD/RagB family
MKNKIYILIVCATALSFWSCNKDKFLTVPSKNLIDDNFVFSSETSSDLVLADLYANLPEWESRTPTGITGAPFGAGANNNYDKFENYSDNSCGLSWFMSWQNLVRPYNADSYDYSHPGSQLYNHDYPCIPFKWDGVYGAIRATNKYLEGMKANEAKFDPSHFKTKLAEARFIRAHLYHQLWMAYGGVPLVKESLSRLTMDSTQLFPPRATQNETAQFIISELSDIINSNSLPNTRSQGRATMGAALALKGWVELFNHKFADAASTYKQIIDGSLYGLYTTPSTVANDARFGPYNEQFFPQNNNNIESIFAMQHKVGVSVNYRLFWANPYYNQVSWSLVQDYRMKDGLTREESPLWQMGAPGFHFYTDREPRFYQSIAYAGSPFFATTYPNEWAASQDKVTGFLNVKGIDQKVPITGETAGNFAANTPMIRYAQVLLQYAEAKIELGQIDQSVYNAIDAVRVRGGIPKLEDSYSGSLAWKLGDQSEMRKIVRREERIELAFENKRYWDLIRWGNYNGATNYYTAMSELNKPMEGAVEEPDGNGFKIKTIHVVSSAFYQKNYLFPIYRGWLESNPNMTKQNGPEWVNGQNPGY